MDPAGSCPPWRARQPAVWPMGPASTFADRQEFGNGVARRQEPYDLGYQPTTPMNAATGIDRTLLLMRHAKSAWPDVPDHDRPLARRGQRDAPLMGRWLRAADHAPDQVICSTARRARETWQLTQAGLGVTPAVAFDNGAYQASAAQLLDQIRHASPEAGTLLVIGHDPAIPELALSLVSATPPVVAGVVRYAAPPAVSYRMREKFPTAAVAIFEFTGHWHQLSAGSARLTWFVTPRDSMTLPVSAICTNHGERLVDVGVAMWNF
jgi:phosphohistidine phosphatase